MNKQPTQITTTFECKTTNNMSKHMSWISKYISCKIDATQQMKFKKQILLHFWMFRFQFWAWFLNSIHKAAYVYMYYDQYFFHYMLSNSCCSAAQPLANNILHTRCNWNSRPARIASSYSVKHSCKIALAAAMVPPWNTFVGVFLRSTKRGGSTKTFYSPPGA